ncbi:hypothetical protein GCM10023231_10230 [Olivibacter ginsenosidimutans]|uniref:GLPGLI family protein n=2 Tax=Olivibacter ginsenosidimutans TaxID=1176537 RepID=A0ABP9AQ71_9SPHI
MGVVSVSILRAQEDMPVLATAHYNFIYVNDTTQRSKYHEEEMILYIAKDASLYESNAGKQVNEQLLKQAKDPAFDGNITIVGRGSTNESYFVRPAEKIFKVVHKLGGRQYLLDENYPEINWKIGQETKTIGGYTCQRADMHFRGRDYTAWFTPDLPFSYGPWKLSGLPGLILEASDSRNEVVFHYVGFDKVSGGELVFGLPSDLIVTEKSAFLNLQEAFKKNPQAVLKAGTEGKTASTPLVKGKRDDMSTQINQVIDPSKIKSINILKTDPERVSNVTNNPIELTD